MTGLRPHCRNSRPPLPTAAQSSPPPGSLHRGSRTASTASGLGRSPAPRAVAPRLPAAAPHRAGRETTGRGLLRLPGHAANVTPHRTVTPPHSPAGAGAQTHVTHGRAGRAMAHLLCNSSLVRFKVSFGDTLAVAPVPDFCVFTRLFLPIF